MENVWTKYENKETYMSLRLGTNAIKLPYSTDTSSLVGNDSILGEHLFTL